MQEETQTATLEDFSSRITVVEQIYYQNKHEDPHNISCGFSRIVKGYEQPYVRWCKATPQWQTIDLGWIAESAGMLIILNEGSYVIDLAFSGDERCWSIYSGESFRGTSKNLQDVVVRCLDGECKYTIHCLSR